MIFCIVFQSTPKSLFQQARFSREELLFILTLLRSFFDGGGLRKKKFREDV